MPTRTSSPSYHPPLSITAARTIFFCTARDALRGNGPATKSLNVVGFDHDGNALTLKASATAVVRPGRAAI